VNPTRVTRLFPLWALLASSAALWRPEAFVPLRAAIVPLLGVVMFGMGMTLTPQSFVEVLRRPRIVALGVALQFTIMPLAAFLIGRSLNLSTELLAGLVLVGSCPGGTASNVITYLARGDVALSITLTTISTLLAVLATPALSWLYLQQVIDVPVGAMLLSVLKIVLVPVVLGVTVNRLIGRRLRPLERLFPMISVIAICLIIGIIVALNAGQLTAIAWPVLSAVVLHNLAGLVAGYGLARSTGCDRRISRTLAIEVGMQNSGLGVALAIKHFSATAAVPGALFSIWHNLSGSLLASLWARDAK
jgi:BASS family bile acid:Na+ symporter